MSDVNDSDGDVAEGDDTAADSTSSFMREYRKVPELGEAWRWYDLVYRPTAFLVDRRPLKKIRTARVLRARLFNSLNRYRDLESFRQWSRQDRNRNLCLAAGENVHLNDIWVAEFFPPSQLPRLQETFREKMWDRARLRVGLHGDNLKSLSESRATGRGRWWRTATVVDRKSSGYMSPEFTREDLPEELQTIELLTVALGPALTAVIARFHLSSTGRSALNSAWHGPHEPRILRQPGRQARAMNRQEVAFRDTAAARADLHSTARRWLSDNCPGIFSNSEAAQPLLDLLLLDKYDPDASEHPTPEARDSLRALGLKDHPWSRLTSQNLPGFILEQMDEDPMVEAFAGTATWTLWGNTTRCVNEAGDLRMYHYDSPVEALGTRYQDDALATLLDLGLWELVLLLRRQNAAARDAAAVRHDQFRRKDALALRRNFLRTSIDTVSIAREVRSYVESRWWGAGFVYTPPARDSERYPSGNSFDKQLRETLKAETDDVTAFDSDYRTIMTAAATLGNAAAALFTSKVALIVSGSSLGVAAINLFLSHCTGDPTPTVPVPTSAP